MLIYIALPLSASAIDIDSLKVAADSAYAQEKYEDAVKIYSELTEQTENADVYYNLGCAYYRMDDMAHAILWFERAAMLNPSDKDINFNLELARSKTIDRITPRHEMFFGSLFNWLSQLFSLSQWAFVCIALFVLSLVGLGLFFFSGRYLLRKGGFYAAVVLFMLTIVANLCANHRRNSLLSHDSAIVVASSVTVKSTPSQSGNDLFVLHEGTRVEIRDASMKDWCEVQIADGKVGWLERSAMEEI